MLLAFIKTMRLVPFPGVHPAVREIEVTLLNVTEVAEVVGSVESTVADTETCLEAPPGVDKVMLPL